MKDITVKDIKNFVDGFINPDNEEYKFVVFNEENSQTAINLGFEIDFDDNVLYKDDEYITEGIEAVMELVKQKFGVEIKVIEIGGYHSPRLDINYYAWAGIVNGELYFDSYEWYL